MPSQQLHEMAFVPGNDSDAWRIYRCANQHWVWEWRFPCALQAVMDPRGEREAIIMLKSKWLVGAGTLALGLGLPILVTAPAAAAAGASRLQMTLAWGQQSSVATLMATIPGSQANLHPVFQFWANDGHGWRMVQNYSAKWTYQLPASQTGTLVMVFGLTQDQWRARDYKAAVYGVRWDEPNARVSLTTPLSPQIGTLYTLTASAASVPDPVYQLWTELPTGKWVSSGAYQPSAQFSWKPLANGTYNFAVYARDGLLPTYAADEVSSPASVSTAGTARSVLFESALPYVPVGGTKTLTATVLNAANDVDSTYSGPVTLSVKSGAAFTVKGPEGPVSEGTVTVDAKDGRAVFAVTGESSIGATGTLTATFPFSSPPVTLTDVSNSALAQVGYGLFTGAGQRISSGNPLMTTGGVPYAQGPLIPVTLKPVNVFGSAVAAGYTDDATLQPYDPQTDPSMVVPSYAGAAVHATGGPDGTEHIDVKEGTTAISLDFHPGPGGLQVLSAVGSPLDISAAITSLAPPSGAVLIPAAISPGKASVSGISPDTPYQVTAVPEANGSPIALSAMVNLSVPNMGIEISSSGPRGTPSLVSVPTWNASKDSWTFRYISGSAANASDTLSFSGLDSLTTNGY